MRRTRPAQPLVLRVGSKIVRELDDYAARMARETGLGWSRSAAARRILELGLEAAANGGKVDAA